MTATAIDHLIASADAMEDLLYDGARQDDPHQLATLAQTFDDGKALRSIVIDVLGPTRRRIALRMTGTQDGEPHVVDLHAIVVDLAQPH